MNLIPRDHWEHSSRDFLRGLGAAFKPRKAAARLPLPGVGDGLPVATGRAALIAAIKALDLPEGARIGVPLYCCSIVFDAVAAAGGKVRFVDIEAETYCVSTADVAGKRDRLDALIAVHMFGNPCDMPGLEALLEGKPIVEDCAHSLGSRIGGRFTGTFGEAAFFSFRSAKYLSVGEGGAVYSKNGETALRLARSVEAMPAFGRGGELKHLFVCYLKSLLRDKPLYGIVGHRLWRRVNRSSGPSGASAVRVGQIAKSDLAVAGKRLSRLASMIDGQRSNADYFLKNLSVDARMLCAERPGTFSNRYLFPIAFPSERARDFCAAYLLKRKIDTMRYLDNVLDYAVRNYGYRGDCPVAEGLMNRILIIPSYYSLRRKEREHIVRSVNEAWAAARDGRDTGGLN